MQLNLISNGNVIDHFSDAEYVDNGDELVVRGNVIYPKSVLGTWSLESGDLPPPPSPVPQVVSRMQLKRAMNQMRLYTTVNNAVMGSGNIDLELYWTETSEFHRDHATLNAMGAQLGFTSAQIDDVFRLAATLN